MMSGLPDEECRRISYNCVCFNANSWLMNCPRYDCLVTKGCTLRKIYLIGRIVESYSLNVEARTGKYVTFLSTARKIDVYKGTQ